MDIAERSFGTAFAVTPLCKFYAKVKQCHWRLVCNPYICIKLIYFRYVRMIANHFLSSARIESLSLVRSFNIEIYLLTVKTLKKTPCTVFVSVRLIETLEKFFNLTLKINIFNITE